MSACDSCRRRRIRCNRLQPCDRCVRSSLLCTYGQNDSRSSVSYTRRLEQRIALLESLVESRNGPSASHDRNTDLRLAEDSTRSNSEPGETSADLIVGPSDDYVYHGDNVRPYHYYRYYAALNILRVIGDACVPNAAGPGRQLLEAIGDLPELPPCKKTRLLPRQERITQLSLDARRLALFCHDCMDWDDYASHLDKILDTDPTKYDANDQAFLGLVYASVALGLRYEKTADPEAETEFKGLSYFYSSRKSTESCYSSRNLDSLRAQIMQIQYLMSYSRVTDAHSVLSQAIADAQQLGMHLANPALQEAFTAEERLQRRRIFAVLNAIDICIASMTGISRLLNHPEPTQLLGLSDDDLADGGASWIAQNPSSTFVNTVIFEKLGLITAEIFELYSGRDGEAGGEQQQQQQQQQEPSEQRIEQLRAQLDDWERRLPDVTRLAQDGQLLHAQLSLRLDLATAGIILHRPFLHHLGRARADARFSGAGYARGSLCVRTAMQAVWLAEALRAHAMFHEANWLHTYSLAYAASILTYFVLCAARRVTVAESMAAVRKSIDMLGEIGRSNEMARRIHASLAPLIDAYQLNLELHGDDEASVSDDNQATIT